jgi:hypothetical protein
MKGLKESSKNATTIINTFNEMIGWVIHIVGIAVGDQGWLCKEHVAFCGVVLGPNVLICLVKEEIVIKGKIETVV